MNKLFLTMTQKIVLPTIVAGTFLLGLFIFAELGFNTVSNLTSSAIDINAERTVLALGALDNINLATIKEKNTLLEKGDEPIATNMREYSQLMESAIKKLDQLKTIASPQEIPVLDEIGGLTVQYRKLAEDSIFPLVKQGDIAKATDLSFNKESGGGRALRQKVRAELENIVEINRNQMRASGLAIKAESARTINILALIAACGSALALVWVSLVQIIAARKGKTNVLKNLASENGDIDLDKGERSKEEVAAVISALELFKDNAAKIKLQAEEEEKEYERKLNDLKKDLD